MCMYVFDLDWANFDMIVNQRDIYMPGICVYAITLD